MHSGSVARCRPDLLDPLERAPESGGDGIGGRDPRLVDRDPVAQLDDLFAIAQRHGRGIDLQLHAGGELSSALPRTR